ncbi:hypothetical protein WA538_005929, partial [Blastocystis sp. DL]
MDAATKVDINVKILLIGDSNVGKSCILMRFIDNRFNELSPTIGVDFKRKLMEVNGRKVRATIWDTGREIPLSKSNLAGQERFRTLTSSYYRGAHGIILVYDVTCQSSFENLQTWLSECENYCTDQADSIVKLLVANKIDLQNRAISTKEGQNFAKQHGMLYIETSAKESIGVNQVFEELVTKVLESPVLMESLGFKASTISVTPTD